MDIAEDGKGARYCCERFASEASSHQAFVGGGVGLPRSPQAR